MDALFNTVSNLWKQDLEEYPLGWEIKKLPQSPSTKFWHALEVTDNFSLYKRSAGNCPCFMITIHNRMPNRSTVTVSPTKESVSISTIGLSDANANAPLVIYSVARFAMPEDARSNFDAMRQQLTVLLSNSPLLFKESNIKLLVDAFSKNPKYGPSHLLVSLGWNSYLKAEWMRDYLHIPDENGVYPIHVACKEGRMDCVKDLMTRGCTFEVVDNEGNTCMHYCAYTDKNLELLQLVHRKQPELLTQINKEEMTVLHVACSSDSIAILKFLRKQGQPLSVMSKNGLPLHVAMKNDSQQCIEYLCEEAPEQLTVRDPNSTQGQLPLHMAQSDKVISALIEHGSSTEAKNSVGKTPLHVMCERRNLTCLLRLLSCDADPNAEDNQGNTPMHCAVLTHKSISSWVSKSDEIVLDLVRALIIFGGDPNKVNSSGQTVRHLVATQTKDSKLLRTLSDVGALRCKEKQCSKDRSSTQLAGACQSGCGSDGTNNGDNINPDWIEPDLSGQIREFISSFERHYRLSTSAATACASNDLEQHENNLVFDRTAKKFSYASIASNKNGEIVNRENILCLDGGGIRGIITLLCLRELQKHLNRPIRESFDWMAGTSTGGIVTLALSLGFSISKTMGIYFRFKDEVFQGVLRPYDHVPLEKLLKDYFTEDAVMTDIPEPKVLITTVLGDRVPPDLFFFSNFDYPNNLLTKDLTHNGKFPPTEPPHKQYIWQVARATSAAPTFFSPFGRCLDGGLMSNNPTLDVITEVFRIHQTLYASNGHLPPRIGCVVSCGTGMVPIEEKSLIVHKPSGILDSFRSVTNLIQLTSTIIDQATVSEGRPVAQAQTWCQMCDIPYVRFNPTISTDTSLNETSDTALLKFSWEAQCFINRNKHLFVKVANYINLLKQQPATNKLNSNETTFLPTAPSSDALV